MPPRTQSRSSETDVGALLGEHLRRARIASGYRSQDALAVALGTDRSVVTKSETGERPPNVNVLTAWLDACEITGQLREVLEGLAKLARTREGPVKQWVAPWFETEAKAHTLRYWAPVIVPGLVQTPAYARELFAAMGHDESKVSELIEIRMGRQAILDLPDSPDVTIALWEPVLRHLIGSPEVMREQLARLVELSMRPRILVHILPGKLGANAGLGGAINLAATDEAAELLLSDGLVEDRLTNDPALVRKASTTFNGVRADALPRSDSRNVITEAMETWSD
ncbi:MAG TPA: helix-turn-helix transcriptional regulator [Streptosporangiaceae bacterium]|jgi:transcriptional regulator with XRE-family HTH domain|nr:helix-turn-helix transcriptional regulator [Streptosporangiaceae bacterium]